MLRHFASINFILVTIFSIVSFSVFATDKIKDKDCVECTYKKVVGAPDITHIEGLEKVVRNNVVKTNYQSIDFEGFHKSFCMKFENVGHVYAFKKEILEAMKKSGYSMEKYWTQVGCVPGKIGGTTTPISHLVAEDAAGRMQFLKALHKYLMDNKEEKTWHKVVNAPNSRGFTMLDYIVYLNSSSQIREEERASTNELIIYLCNNGGVFTNFKNNKCPLSI